MNLPSEGFCFELIRKMGMLDHIVDHSVMVCRVAMTLGRGLEEQGIELNGELIRSAALLHDITKTRSFRTGEQHSLTGGMLLRELGFFEVGEVIRQHVFLDDYDFSGPPTEAEIVNYADKRVLHDQVASLDDRMAYILEQYGDSSEKRQRIRRGGRLMERLEKKLFSGLAFPADTLSEHIVEEGLKESYLAHGAKGGGA